MVLKILLALVVAYLIFKVGFMLLGSFARPVPEPPPSGELRRIKLRYRCPTCGMELRVDRADEELPPPPRHCQDEMDLVTADDEL